MLHTDYKYLLVLLEDVTRTFCPTWPNPADDTRTRRNYVMHTRAHAHAFAGRNGVDLYAQTAASGAWVWAGNFGAVTERTVPTNEICGPLTALTDDDVSSKPNLHPLNTSAATRFMMYRRCLC